MKKTLLIASIALASFSAAQNTTGKVGINTTTPKASLDINVAPANASATATTPEGILIPRVTRERLINMGTGTAIETSTLVFVNDVTTGSATGTAEDVTAPGFYYYNGTKWVTMGGGIAIEPWKDVATGNPASSNTQNIYQTGNVGVGSANPSKKLSVKGETALSLDGSAPYDTNGPATLYLSENATTRSPRIQFHSSGLHEGFIELANTGSRRMIFNDNQGVGLGIDVKGRTTTLGFAMPDGNQGANKILTSDANGVATWQTATTAANGNFILNQYATQQAANFNINGNGKANYLRAGVDNAGYTSLASGGTTNAGYLEIWNANATRNGYIGYFNNEMNYTSEIGNHIFRGGNVGINEASPTAKLQVTGLGGGNIDLKVNGRLQTGDTASAGGLWVDGSANNMFIGQLNADTMGFYGGGNVNSGIGWNLIMNKNNGYVGLGTLSPWARLDVRGGTTISRDGTNPYGDYTLALSESASSNKSPRISFHSGGASEGFIELNREGSRRIIFNDNQGLGLGIDVKGRTTTLGFAMPDGNQGANKVLTSDANGVGTWQTATAAANGNFILNQFATEQSANYKISGNGQAASIRGGVDGGGYAFLAGGGANNAGYLDIRKADNSRVGYIGYLKDYMFYQSDVGNHVFGGTNVGIGESNPTSKLHITGSGGGNIDLRVNGRIQTGDASNGGGLWIDAANTMFIGQPDANRMGFYGSGAGWNLIMNKNNGNVGVGTANPLSKLHVNNGNTPGAVRIEDGTQGDGKVLKSDANGVGTWQNAIGTSAPSASDMVTWNAAGPGVTSVPHPNFNVPSAAIPVDTYTFGPYYVPTTGWYALTAVNWYFTIDMTNPVTFQYNQGFNWLQIDPNATNANTNNKTNLVYDFRGQITNYTVWNPEAYFSPPLGAMVHMQAGVPYYIHNYLLGAKNGTSTARFFRWTLVK